MARVGGHAHHQPVGKHGGASRDGGAVAAGLADDRGRLAGNGALVHRCGAHDDLAIGGDLLACRHVEQVLLLQNRRTHLVGLQAEELSRIVHVMALRHQALVELVRGHIALGGAQRVGLRLAAALGERLREVREQHREPEHRRDGNDEAGLRVRDAEQRQHEQGERQYGRQVHHEHNGVLRLLAGSKLHEGVAHGALRQMVHFIVPHSCRCHFFFALLP